jgi:hypothetical protein
MRSKSLHRRLAAMGSSRATGPRYGSVPDEGDQLRNVEVSCVLCMDVIIRPRRFHLRKGSSLFGREPLSEFRNIHFTGNLKCVYALREDSFLRRVHLFEERKGCY